MTAPKGYGTWEYVPPCGDPEPHQFHNHTWIDMHFKNQSVWCPGLCTWCHPFSDNNLPHGSGEHK